MDLLGLRFTGAIAGKNYVSSSYSQKVLPWPGFKPRFSWLQAQPSTTELSLTFGRLKLLRPHVSEVWHTNSVTSRHTTLRIRSDSLVDKLLGLGTQGPWLDFQFTQADTSLHGKCRVKESVDKSLQTSDIGQDMEDDRYRNRREIKLHDLIRFLCIRSTGKGPDAQWYTYIYDPQKLLCELNMIENKSKCGGFPV